MDLVSYHARQDVLIIRRDLLANSLRNFEINLDAVFAFGWITTAEDKLMKFGMF
jgi:hypothetical protein